ncbi:MAG: ABC transporter ATP-binding protein [Firmicutes bacterium HGW-Firmicutes-21]|nr:MAG: ABC transporter ATP-binding protein [Firmicutes bacterium HGW-Firmicutes-21]
MIKKKKPKTPPERTRVRERVKAECGGSADFGFDFNLTSDNNSIFGASVISGGIIYLAVDGDENIVKMVINDIEEFKYISNIGCVAIEYTVGGEDYELCRSDMCNAFAMQAAVKKLTAIKEGRNVGGKDFEICPKCGKTLRPGSTVCLQCVNKKRLFLRLLPYAKPYTGQLIVAGVLFLLISCIHVLIPVLTRKLIDEYINAENPNFSGFWWLIAAIAACGLLVALFSMIRRTIVVKTGNNVLVKLRQMLYEKIQALSLAGITRRSAGELITRITSDSQVLKEFLVFLLPDLLQQFLIIITVTTIMLVLDWKLTLLIMIPVPLMFLLFSAIRKFTHKLFHRQWNMECDLSALLHDVFSGMRVVKVFGTEKKEEDRFSKSARRVADISKKNELTWNLIVPFASFLLGIGEFAVVLIIGNRILDGTMQLGELTQFIAYVAIIYGPIRWMAFVPRRIARTATSLAKVFELIDEKSDLPDALSPITSEIHGDIEFKNACFGYNSYEYVLKNINLEIKNGEMVGLVGRSGVGKTTAINLIMRLYDITSGELLIDGEDIRSYSQHSLRSQMGVVLQETFLFNGTIFQNIVYAKPDSTRDEVIRAAMLANAHEFILKQPDGYNTYVGDKGHTLSGGERQRIAIARAILRNPRILILDEATASLDTETEKQIQDALNRLTNGRTTIAIAHRLSTLRNATKLVVFEKGTIEEIGTHDELMRTNGRYYKLVMAQRQMSKLVKNK